MNKEDFKILMYALYGNKQLIIPDGQTLKEWIDNAFVEKQEQAINYTHSCTTLKDKEAPTLKDAFIAGYKKRALMSGLKYDKVSELNAISNFKCWMSFDLNL